MGNRKICLWVIGDDPARVSLTGVLIVLAHFLAGYWDKTFLEAAYKIRLFDASKLAGEERFNGRERSGHRRLTPELCPYRAGVSC